MRTISRTRDTSFSYGREIRKAQSVVKKTINDGKSRPLVRYIKAVAKLRKKGNGLFVAGIKKISDLGMAELKIPMEEMRLINIYIKDLGPDGAEVSVEKTKRALN